MGAYDEPLGRPRMWAMSCDVQVRGSGARGWQATGGRLLDVDHTVPRVAWGLHGMWE